MSPLKGITYADKPEIGIPIAAKLLENTNNEEYISAAVYLGYRILDHTYSNKDYMGILKAAFDKSNELDITTINGYRWHLSLNLLNACLNALTTYPPKLELENLEKIYYLKLLYSSQLANYSKLSILLYYHKREEDIRSFLMNEIKKHMVYGEKIEQMSYNALHDVIIPLLSEDQQVIKRTIAKYKNWYIYKHYINTLSVYTKTS